jgi:hypothetical protein
MARKPSAPPDNSPEAIAWLSEDIEPFDELGIKSHVGATYVVPSYLTGGFDNRKAMRLYEIGEIVWFQTQEHEVVATYPDYCGGHSYGLVSLATGVATVTSMNVQGWGARTREEWELVSGLEYEQVYPKLAECPGVSLQSFLRDMIFRMMAAVRAGVGGMSG